MKIISKCKFNINTVYASSVNSGESFVFLQLYLYFFFYKFKLNTHEEYKKFLESKCLICINMKKARTRLKIENARPVCFKIFA